MTDLKIQTFFFWSKWDTWRNKSTREIILRWQWEFLAITVTSAIYVPSILVLTNQITRFLIKVDNTFSFSISNTFRSGYLEFKIIHWVSATYGGEVKLPLCREEKGTSFLCKNRKLDFLKTRADRFILLKSARGTL